MRGKIEGLKVEGEPLKRYVIRYQGALEWVGTFDTAAEALVAYEDYEQTVRPMIDRENKWGYAIRDGKKDISVADLRRAAKAQEEAAKKAAKVVGQGGA
jgi:hypothetical protein